MCSVTFSSCELCESRCLLLRGKCCIPCLAGWGRRTATSLCHYPFDFVIVLITISGLIQAKQLWGAIGSHYFKLLKNMVIGYTRLTRRMGTRNIRGRSSCLRVANAIVSPRTALFARTAQQDFMIYESLLVGSRKSCDHLYQLVIA